MKQLSSKIVCGIAAVITFFWGVLSMALNGASKAEATGSLKIVVWYMVLQSFLFVLLSVAAILRITANKKTAALQKGVYAVATVIAALYSLLLAINIAPQISSLFTATFWKQSGAVMALAEPLLYLIQGILLAVLSADMLRGKLTRRGELTRIATGCVILSLIPYAVQFFGVGLQLVLTVGAGLVLAVLTVCQAGVVYTAFVPIVEG